MAYGHADETVKERMMSDTCTIWVCSDCMFHHCYGECGSCHENILANGEGTDAHDQEPWCWVDNAQQVVTMGMLTEQHSCIQDHDGSAIDCNCETKDYSASSCDGCGSILHGERHAFTVWFED